MKKIFFCFVFLLIINNINFAQSHSIQINEIRDTLINNHNLIVSKISDQKPGFKSLNPVSNLDRVIVYFSDGLTNILDSSGHIINKKVKSGDCFWIPAGQKTNSANLGNESLSFFEIVLKPWSIDQNEIIFPDLDPVKIQPEYYLKKFENNKVRAALAIFPPGVKIKMHEHITDRVIVFITDHPLKLILPDGKIFDLNDHAGSAFYAGAAIHAEENLSEIVVKTFILDIKKK